MGGLRDLTVLLCAAGVMPNFGFEILVELFENWEI